MQNPLLEKLRIYLQKHLGLNFTDRSENELYKKIGYAAEDFNFHDANSFIHWILKTELNPRQTEKLASFLTIGETYFFREKKTLDYLEKIYLPALIKKRENQNQYIRIWSAGCASGEEPYSIAIMLKRLIPDIENWKISILATDINAQFIEKAKKGIYSSYSFRKIPESFRKTYFVELEENKFQILPEYQSMVSFAFVNLATDSYPSLVNNTNAMDIILCRNVLIYFSEDGIRQVSHQLYDSLITDGVLLLSPVEMSSLISSRFDKIPHEGVTIYTKGSGKKEQKKIIKQNVPDYKRPNKEAVAKIQIPAKKSLEKNPKKTFQKNIKIETEREKEDSAFALALDFYKQGDFEASRDLLNNLLKLGKENNEANIKLLIKAEANLGNLEQALALCFKALEKNKLDADMYYLKANIQQELGNDMDAIESLKRVVYIEPEYVLAYFSLGFLSTKTNNKNSAKYYKNALNLISKYPPEEILPMSDGLTAGRLSAIINNISQ